MSTNLSGYTNGSSFQPMMMSGPEPTCAASAALGVTSGQLSESILTLMPVAFSNFAVF